MNIAIVILNWNGKKLLEQFLPSVIKYSKEARIYLADNASTDNSVSFVKDTYPSIKIIQNKENGGYAKGYNDALKEVNADIFCLLNSDVEVTKHWLKPIVETFKKELLNNPDITAVTNSTGVPGRINWIQVLKFEQDDQMVDHTTILAQTDFDFN